MSATPDRRSQARGGPALANGPKSAGRGIVEACGAAGKDTAAPAPGPDGARCAVALSFELRPRDRRAARGAASRSAA